MTDLPAKTVLITLGRLPIALDLARSFSMAGWRVLVAEPFGMHLARMSRAVSRCYTVTAPAQDATAFRRDLESIVAREQVNLIVPVSEESMHLAALRDTLPDSVDMFCMPQAHLLSLHDKLEFARMAEHAGLAVPDTARLGDRAAVSLLERGDVVVKPRYSCSGRGVQVLHRGQTLPPVDTLPPGGAVVQAYQHGELCSSFSLARAGQLLVTVAYRAVVLSGSVAVCFERLAAASAVEQWVADFVRSIGHTGFVAFDFIIGESGVPHAIECNPRATSGLHFVDTAALAAAVAGENTATVPLREQPLLQESYSCFTATLGATLRGDRVGHHWRALREARDISWSRQDPWPFLLMPINTWPLIRRALWRRQTFAEVAALDIEWRAAADAR